MNRRTLLSLIGLGSVAAPALAQSKKSGAKQRLILQVSDNDPAKWSLALTNAKMVQLELGQEHVQIEIIAYGPGLEMLKGESKVADRLAGALDDNVGLIACENTMTTTQVTKDDLYGGIAFVKTGVAHIMKRQREGWAYVRP
jgi:uncharacterized protein